MGCGMLRRIYAEMPGHGIGLGASPQAKDEKGLSNTNSPRVAFAEDGLARPMEAVRVMLVRPAIPWWKAPPVLPTDPLVAQVPDGYLH